VSGIRLPRQIEDAMYHALTAQGFDPSEIVGVFCDGCHTLFWVEADIDGVPHLPDHDCERDGQPQP
jgi:hypothetical protein